MDKPIQATHWVTRKGETESRSFLWWIVVPLLMTPMPVVLRNRAWCRWTVFTQNCCCDLGFGVPYHPARNSEDMLLYMCHRVWASVQKCMPSICPEIMVPGHFTFLLPLLAEVANSALICVFSVHFKRFQESAFAQRKSGAHIFHGVHFIWSIVSFRSGFHNLPCQCSLVVEHWQADYKPEALGTISSDTTFLWSPLPLQTSMDSKGPVYIWD